MAADEEKGEAGVTLQHANSQVLQSGSMSEECTLTTPSSQGQSIGTGSLKSVEPLSKCSLSICVRADGEIDERFRSFSDQHLNYSTFCPHLVVDQETVCSKSCPIQQ